MPFSTKDVEDLLVQCHRRCCICHRFCGVKIETDHIVQGGGDTIDNAIAVCFECHAEIHAYNDQHPRGRKFRPDELRKHRDQWLAICRDTPGVLIGAIRNADVGPLQALIDELEFNGKVAQHHHRETQGCLFQTEQFTRAIRESSIALLNDEVKNSILDAYVDIGRANQHISSVMLHPINANPWSEAVIRAEKSIADVRPKIETAQRALLRVLGGEHEAARKHLAAQDRPALRANIEDMS